ncbi:conserved hypothetical protein [Uncinocarpus reesii 1704]|uniref:Protein kinase activator Bem1 n=1 Tax=Uncinocarpus reesii (strain UAMH 1704) TaxID=336963 RepID=C4JH76_UNCRE|nr:uncharacterized protein UREG_02649 [Uncinocarpus reesii 1704]EEP77800.1 conserved hypothetical protein [Uncinocarpus reesii 1704]
MKAIRRSLKGDKDQKPQHVSITPKSAIAILPPKKVIRALFDYTPDPANTHELAFSKGDFFHVISREDDSDWYEACNPLSSSARGLVPVSFFEVIGKTERNSGGSVGGLPEERPEFHNAESFERSSPPATAITTTSESATTNTTKQGARARMSSIGKTVGAMVYGVVQYDFHAERPDELEARAGEAIIVIAQSNPEWFVAKPIGRLGGPGLIPVSFIEVRDMTTGQPVSDPHEAVKRAGVPRVEEWKKMTAEYKNSSITLGKFEAGGVQSAAAEIEKMSLNNSGLHNSNDYKLLAMPPHISRCQLVRQLFAPRAGDFEMDPTMMTDEYRLSSGSQPSSGHDPSPSASRQSSQGQMNNYPSHQRSQGSVSQSSVSRIDPQQMMIRQGSALTQASVSSTSNANAIRIKVFFQDDIIVVRVPADIMLEQLRDKIRDRLKVEEDILLRYKDEPSRGFVDLMSDADLEVAIQRNTKLMVYVGLA